jgi:serine/threonine protein kinase
MESNDEQNKETVKDNYLMVKSIGKGSFGTVYLTTDKDENQYAAKVELINENSRLDEEYQVYKSLLKKHNATYVSKIYSFMKTPTQNIMIMELLGPSLESMFIKHNKKFNTGTVMLLGIDILNILEHFHKSGFIHRDIKPNNFLTGINENYNKIYLTDFGLSKNYIKKEKHINFATRENLIGTLRYASVNVHLGIEPSRRDDLESLGYMMVYFLNSSLPWMGKKQQGDQMDIIGEIKMTINLSKSCEIIPKQLIEFIALCKNMQFSEEPNYEKLRKLLIEIAEENKSELKYQWSYNDVNNDLHD